MKHTLRKLIFLTILFFFFPTKIFGAVKGYPGKISVFNNQKLRLHIAATTPVITVFIYKVGETQPKIINEGKSFIQVRNLSPLTCPAAEFGCDWKESYSLSVEGWESGLYQAYLIEGAHSTPPNNILARKEDKSSIYESIPFIVKNIHSQNKILLQLPTNTWQAYNNSGFLNSSCLYPYPQCRNHQNSIHLQSVEISFERPFHKDVTAEVYPFIKWAKENDIPMDFAANHDLENYPFISRYKLIISVGHDEYWTKTMKENLEKFRDAGGNLIFLTSNTIFWNSRYQQAANMLVSYKNYIQFDPFNDNRKNDYDPTLVTGRFPFVNNHEATLLGNFSNELPGKGGFTLYSVADPSVSWIFEGTGLKNNDKIGELSSAAGAKEVDSTPFNFINNIPVPKQDFTPAKNLKIIGVGDRGQINATMTIYNSKPDNYSWGEGATVFSAGSWNWVTQSIEKDSRIQRITFNLVKKMSIGSPPNPQNIAEEKEEIFVNTPGQEIIKDTTIHSFYPTKNFNESDVLELRDVNTASILVKFGDQWLNNILSNKKIISASMEFYLLNSPQATISISVIPLKVFWDETIVSWEKRDRDNSWQIKGAMGQSDRDSDRLPIDRKWLYPETPANKKITIDLTKLLIEWQKKRRPAYGFKLENSNINKRVLLASSQHPNPEFRPKIKIIWQEEKDFLTPSPTPALTSTPTPIISPSPTSLPRCQIKYLTITPIDTMINKWEPTRNYATAVNLQIREAEQAQIPLFYFSLNDLINNKNIKIKKGLFKFFVDSRGLVTKYRVYQMKKDWFSRPEITNYQAGYPWSAPGALSDEDQSLYTPSGADFFISITGTGYYQVDITGLVSQWLAAPQTNYGFAFRAFNSAFNTYQNIFSSENPDVNKRPVLEIEYEDCSEK